MHRNESVFEARIVESEYIRVCIRRQNKCLLNLIRIELNSIQCRNRIIKRIIIYRRGKFDNRRRIARNSFNFLILCNFSACAGLSVCNHINNLIARSIRFMTVNEGDFVILSRERNRLSIGIRAITRNRDRRFLHFLSDREVRIGNNLVIRNRIVLFIHIMDDIRQCCTCPVRINGGVLRNLFVPVKELITVSCGVPTIEDKSFLRRIGGCFHFVVLFNSPRIHKLRCRVVTVYKVDRVARRIPFSVKHQRNTAIGRARRHGRKGIGVARQTGIRIPSAKSEIAIDAPG